MWSDKWSLLENARGQCWHWKGLAPVCFRICRVSSSERANLQVHPSQVQRYGFSPIKLWQILKNSTQVHEQYAWSQEYTYGLFHPYLYVFDNEPLDESFLYRPYYNQENCIYVSFDAHFVSSVVMHLAHWVVRAYTCILYHLYLGKRQRSEMINVIFM